MVQRTRRFAAAGLGIAAMLAAAGARASPLADADMVRSGVGEVA